MKKYSNKPAA